MSRMERKDAEKKAKIMMYAARNRAKNKKVPYSLGWSDMMSIQSILMGGHCDMSGQEFGRGPFASWRDGSEALDNRLEAAL